MREPNFFAEASNDFGRDRVGGIGPFEHEIVAPFARHEILHQAVHELRPARHDVHELGRAQFAAQRIVGRADVEQQRILAFDRSGERLVGLRRRIDEEEVKTAAYRGCDRGRDLHVRLHGDAFEREIGLEHARQRRGLVDADLRARIRVLAGLQDQPLVGADRLVARIAVDLDEADGELLLLFAAAGAVWAAALACR